MDPLVIAAIIKAGSDMVSGYGDQRAAKDAGKPRKLTPQEQWLWDRKQDDFQYNPYRDYQGSAAHQVMQQMFGANRPDMDYSKLFASDQFKGFQMPQAPKIDFSGMPLPWQQNRPGAGSGRPGAPGDDGRGVPGVGKGAGGESLPSLNLSPSEDRFGGNREIVDYDNHTGNPAYSGQGPKPTGVPGTGPGSTPAGFDIPGVNQEGLIARATDWLRNNPRSAATAEGAIKGLLAAGFPGAIAYGAYKNWRASQQGPQG